ncbi:MAG: helix-turn-helix domain-containing protein [Acidobacteria bacterium]|nr:helix-turn-helix domain-containing protein [Acidobacteriota bacterium]
MSVEPLLTTKQAALLLGLNHRSIEALRLRGGGPRFVKLGRAVRYRPADLAEWTEAGLRRSTSDPGSEAA